MFSTFVYTSSADRLNANTSNSPAARWVSTENRGTSALAQQRLEIAPRRVRAFGDGVVAFVEDLVEDLQPLVGQPDLVGVGVGEQPRHPVFRRVGGLRHRLRTRCNEQAFAPAPGAVRAAPRVKTCSEQSTGAGPRRRRSRAPRPDTAARVRYRIRRMWTLWTIPNSAKYVIRLDPPYDTNGIGKPVTGMMPSVIPTFWNSCQSSIVNTPAHR